MPDHNRVFRAIRPCPRMRKVCLHRGRKGRPFAPNPQQAAFLRQRNRRIRKRRIWRSNRRKHVAIARASRGIRLYELVPRSAPRLLWFDSGRTSDLPARGGGTTHKKRQNNRDRNCCRAGWTQKRTRQIQARSQPVSPSDGLIIRRFREKCNFFCSCRSPEVALRLIRDAEASVPNGKSPQRAHDSLT